MKLRITLLILTLAAAACAWALWPKAAPQASARIIGLDSPPAEGFARADGARTFQFPLDFGPHPDFQTEWWYYTGNLVSADGRQFGYQLTFFRRALTPAAVRMPRPSNWAAEQVYLAHFTLTDVGTGKFHYFERMERGSAGLAGAQVQPAYQVWLSDWRVSQVGEGSYQLAAASAGVQLKLDLQDRKGVVLQGEQGYSQKGPEAGNASYYLSQTRLETRGTVEIGGQPVSVTGSSWMDHEFSTSALAGDQVGWDWFALQLNDGSELMVYTVRKADGSIDPYSSGTLIYPDGRTRRLTRADFQVRVTASWKSPHSAAVYPASWQVDVPSEGLSLQVKPRLADQELRVSFTYWEGAVAVEGTRSGIPVSGSGYVELTGYAESMQGRF
jgi:predicted secreted hydrolase